MSQPKDLQKYPPEFLTIAARFIADVSPLPLHFDKKKEALRTRFRLYGFKDVLREIPELSQLYATFLSTEIGMMEKLNGGAALIIRMPEDAPEMKALSAALMQGAHGEGSRSPATVERSLGEPSIQALTQSSTPQDPRPGPLTPGHDGSATESAVDDFLKKEE